MSTHIPFDIQEQIFERFPVKSLIRFRSVCKAWKSFIDSAEFIAGYRTQSQHLMIRYEVGPMDVEEVKFVDFVDDSFPQQKFAPTVPPFVQPKPKIIDSSHGLLCLTNKYEGMAVLWNPAIRKSIVVGLPNVVLWPLFYSVFGFGVCPVTKDPKLVHVTYIKDHKKMESISCFPSQVMVFTLSSGEWTTLPSSRNLPRKSIVFTGLQTVIGQFIYLLAYDRSNGFRDLIMSFDLSTYEFRELHVPDSLLWSSTSLSRLRESLVLLDYDISFTADKRVCDVWMMEHGDSKVFTKLFTVNAPNATVWQTAGFRKSGEPIVEIEIVQGDNEDICTRVVYEPCSKHIMDLGIHGNCGSSIASSYTESLLLLDHDDGALYGEEL